MIVALLVLSTLVILNALQRPTAGREAGGVDLGRLAADTLDVMGERRFPANTGMPLEEWVAAVMAGNSAKALEVHDFLAETLPPGAQYELRLGNGVDSIRLLPPNTDRQPLAARAASTYVMPAWSAGADTIADPVNATVAVKTPGAAFDWSAWTDLVFVAPSDNSTNGPDNLLWLEAWARLDGRHPDPAVRGTKTHVPLAVPYGVWEYRDDDGCDPCYLHVVPASGATAQRYLYSLDLVVWYGA